MKEIIDKLNQLRGAFAQHEGEILSITLNKKGADALNVECQDCCSICCVVTCPTCGGITDKQVLGIRIVESMLANRRARLNSPEPQENKS